MYDQEASLGLLNRVLAIAEQLTYRQLCILACFGELHSGGAGDGTLRLLSTSAATDDTERDSIVAYATEAVDNSGGGTAVFISARVA